MEQFLKRIDYSFLIRDRVLQGKIDEDQENRLRAEIAAQSEISSYLIKSYDIDKIFTIYNEHSDGPTYPAGTIVYTIVAGVTNRIEWYRALIETNQPLNSPTDWQQVNDPRNQLIVRHMIDVSIYTLLARSDHNDIPELRLDRYTDCIDWLTKVSNSEIGTDLPLLQEDGEDVSTLFYGSNPKKTSRLW